MEAKYDNLYYSFWITTLKPVIGNKTPCSRAATMSHKIDKLSFIMVIRLLACRSFADKISVIPK